MNNDNSSNVDNKKRIIEEAIKNRDVKSIVKYLFNFDITEGQEEIIKRIIFDRERRLVITAVTRYGKTRSIAIAILLYVLFNSNSSVGVVAPQMSQAKKIRDYIGEHIVDSDIIQELIDINVSGIDRLKKEASRKRLTFKNDCEVNILSAAGDANRLMGEGASGLLIIDECALIENDVYNSKIRRMLGDSKDTQEVLIGNPWHRQNQFFDAWKNDKYYNIKIDWEQAVDEGRISKEFINEQRELLTDREFTVLYEASFPTTREDALVGYKYIRDAEDRELELGGDIYYGVDVAGKGTDKTVLSIIENEGNQFKLLEITEIDEDNPSDIVNKLDTTIGKGSRVFVDSIGIGAGVKSGLEEKGHDSIEVKVSKNSTKDKDRFLNMKSQLYWKLRELFERGNIDIIKSNQLRKQLSEMSYEFTSSGRIKILDPERSPDYADALMLSIGKNETKSIKPGSVTMEW